MERSEMIMMASQSNQMDYHRTYRYTIFICPVSIPQVPASNNVTLKNLIIKEIITSYMSNMRNQPDFTHSLILVHGTKNSPIVTIRVGKDETVLGPMKGVVSNWFHVEVPRSNLLHSSQINPQLYLLGNILIRFNDIFDAHCNRNPYSDSSDLKSEIRDLCQQLDSGHPPSEGWTGIYPREFIFSCLSHQFAKKAFLSDPKLKILKYIGVAGVGIATVSNCVVPGLSLLGWGSKGVLANSYAASLQSGMGCVAKGSLFAKLQSVGATGGLAFGVFSAFGAGAATIANEVSDHLREFSSTSYLYLYTDDPTDLSTLKKLIDCEGFYYVSK